MISVSALPKHVAANLVKRGPVFRMDYPPEKLRELVNWFRENYELAVHGDLCGVETDGTKVRKHRLLFDLSASSLIV